MYIIALSGMPKAGKGVVSEILSMAFGYRHISMSDLLRRQITTDYGIPYDEQTRSLLFEKSLEYRMKYGGEYLARLAMNEAHMYEQKGESRFIIDGMRHPHELLYLKLHGAHPAAILCDLDRQTDYQIRLNRFLRKPDERGVQFEDPAEFKKIDEMEWGNEHPFGTHIGDVIRLIQEKGDRIIVNAESTRIEDIKRDLGDFVYKVEGIQRYKERM